MLIGSLLLKSKYGLSIQKWHHAAKSGINAGLHFSAWGRVEEFPLCRSAQGFPGSAGVRYSWWLHCDDGRGHKPRAIPLFPHHHCYPPSLPTQNNPWTKPLCGDITTVADSWWRALGAPCVSMCPPPPSNCQPVNSSFTRAQTRIRPSLTASVLQKYFLKNNTVYSLAFNFQASVNLVMSCHRTEERLINVKPSVCHHT